MKKPLWFVYSGMGSQWPGMGKDLLQVPLFYQSIERCHNALKPFGVDVFEIITSKDGQILDSILNCFVGIISIQVNQIILIKNDKKTTIAI